MWGGNESSELGLTRGGWALAAETPEFLTGAN